jgi:cytochrome c-type biogenesis protein CcmH
VIPGASTQGRRLRTRGWTVVAFLTVFLLVAVPLVAHADALDDGVRRVALQLQCPVCEGETVADSPSGLAGDMRGVIRAKLAAGESDQQILDEFVASYGDSILTEPPKRGISLGVWIGPLIGVALGSVLVVLLLRAWRRPAATPVSANPAALDNEVADEFHRYRQEFSR